MDSQPLCLFFSIIWMFVFFLHHVRSQQGLLMLSLEPRVFVAFKGGDLSIDCHVTQPANQSTDTLTCFDPAGIQIYSCPIPSTADSPQTHEKKLMLKHLDTSGEYCCKYQKAAVYWFVHVRDGGFKMPEVQHSTEFILVGAVTSVLLIFSIVGSVYVFRKHWMDKCRKADEKENQNKETAKKRRGNKETVTAVSESSTSFYASLEPRTRSIYDELHPSPAKKGPEQQKAKSKKKEPHQTKQQSKQDEGQFESVYENY